MYRYTNQCTCSKLDISKCTLLCFTWLFYPFPVSDFCSSEHCSFFLIFIPWFSDCNIFLFSKNSELFVATQPQTTFFFYCQYQVLINYFFKFLWLPGQYVSWSNGQYCLFDMSSFSPSMVTAQQWNFVIVNLPVVTCNVSWTSIRTLNGKYLFHHTVHSSLEDFLLFLIFSFVVYITVSVLFWMLCCVQCWVQFVSSNMM